MSVARDDARALRVAHAAAVDSLGRIGRNFAVVGTGDRHAGVAVLVDRARWQPELQSDGTLGGSYLAPYLIHDGTRWKVNHTGVAGEEYPLWSTDDVLYNLDISPTAGWTGTTFDIQDPADSSVVTGLQEETIQLVVRGFMARPGSTHGFTYDATATSANLTLARAPFLAGESTTDADSMCFVLQARKAIDGS